MLKRIYIIISVIALAGCTFFQAPGKDRCDKIISREKMTGILTDVYLLEGYLLELQVSRPNIRDSAAFFFQTLFEKHDISYETFNKALSCYLLHRDDIEKIHEDILNQLSIMLSETQADPSMPMMAPEADMMEAPDLDGFDEAPAPESDTIPLMDEEEAEEIPEMELMMEQPEN
jgi:hypothetical protein